MKRKHINQPDLGHTIKVSGFMLIFLLVVGSTLHCVWDIYVMVGSMGFVSGFIRCWSNTFGMVIIKYANGVDDVYT